MLRERSTFYLLPLLFFVLSGLASDASAQVSEKYTGPYQAGNYRGQAEFSFLVIEGDTVIDGPFRLQRSNLQALLTGADDSFSISGTMDRGTPVGRWAFEFGTFQSDSATRVEGYAYRLSITGEQFSAEGSLDAGRPDGTWKLEVNRIDNSEVASRLFSSQLEFDKGKPLRSFRMEHPDGTLVGRFLRNGLAHDQWTLFGDDAAGSAETWVFEEGLLQRITTGGETYSFFAGPTGNTQQINLDKRYLALLERLRPADSSAIRNLYIRHLLAENASYYAKMDSLLSDIGDAAFQPEFKVLVPHYPLDSVERLQVDSIRVLIRGADSVSRSLRGDPHLNILRRSDGQVSSLMSAVDTIATNHLRPLIALIELDNKDLLEYIPREQLNSSLWPNGFPAKNVDLGDANEVTLNLAAPAPGLEMNIAGYLTLATYTATLLSEIESVLDRRVEAERNQDELLALEARMVDRAEQLGQLADSLLGAGAVPVTKTLRALASDTEARLAEYGTLPGGPGRLEAARDLASCLDRFADLGVAISRFPEQRQQITDRYSDRVWNPFTATLMDEQVKRRLTSAYHEVLVPYILNSVAAQPDCERAPEWAKLTEDLFNRIMELREEDTSRLERRLRKERDPQTVLELLNLQPAGQDE